jgi:hypothetical protein
MQGPLHICFPELPCFKYFGCLFFLQFLNSDNNEVTLSPYISLAILAAAFFRLRGCFADNYQISRSQIILQMTSAIFYALSNTALFIFSNSWSILYIRITLDSVSFFILTLTF